MPTWPKDPSLLGEPVIHDPNEDAYTALARAGQIGPSQLKLNQQAGIIDPAAAAAAQQSMAAKPFVPPTAAIPQVNMMSDAAAQALNPGMAGQVSGFGSYTPEQLDATMKRFQQADQTALNQSYGKGLTETGQNVRDLDFYLKQIGGPNTLASQYSPSMRMAALGMQNQDADQLMRRGQEEQKIAAAEGMRKMELKQQMDIANMQFDPDRLARREFDSTFNAGKRAGRSTEQSTLEATAADEQRQVAMGKQGIATPASDRLSAQEDLKKAVMATGEGATAKQVFSPQMLAQLLDARGNKTPGYYQGLMEEAAKVPGGQAAFKKAIAERVGRSIVIGTGKPVDQVGGFKIEYAPQTMFGRANTEMSTSTDPYKTGPGFVNRKLIAPTGEEFDIESALPGSYGRQFVSDEEKHKARREYDSLSKLLEKMDQK